MSSNAWWKVCRPNSSRELSSLTVPAAGADRVFQATQEISFNEKAIVNAENTVRACEEELEKLGALGSGGDTSSSLWFLGPSSLGRSQAVLDRAKHLLEKMRTAVKKVEALEKRNGELKKALAQEGR
jgi:hypothetical protein